MATTITISAQFCGPPGTGNGGYVAGRFAAFLDASADQAVEVTLRAPVPLETPLTLHRDGGPSSGPSSGPAFGPARSASLLAGAAQLASARVVPFDVTPWGRGVRVPVSFRAARELAGGARLRDPDVHPCPGCFVCGPSRASGDGMRLFPARVPERDDFAVAWRVEHPGAEFVWAALDCPSSYPMYMDEAPFEGPCVLGRITALVARDVEVGERCVVMAWREAADGRKLQTASGVYDDAGALVGAARATWIRVAT